MTSHERSLTRLRTRWSAIGAAVAITLGAGGIGLAQAAVDSGDKPITVTVDSKRILDTRTNLGLAGAFAKDTPRDVQVTGAVDVATATGTTNETVVPAGASAVLVNVTVVTPTDIGFLTLRAGGAAGAPSTSTVNFAAPGGVEPNAATVDLSADGKVQVWVFMPSPAARADVLIDVVGYTIDHNHDDRYYTETEVDAAVGAKANSADIYTKTETDTLLDPLRDEPAVAFNFDGLGGTTSQFIESVISVTIAAPTAGFVKVDGSLEVVVPSGTSGLFGVSASNDAWDATGSNGPLKTFSNANASTMNVVVAEEKVYAVAAGTHTYYLNIEGSGRAWDDATLAAVFFATSGGTVTDATTSTPTASATGASE